MWVAMGYDSILYDEECQEKMCRQWDRSRSQKKDLFIQFEGLYERLM